MKIPPIFHSQIRVCLASLFLMGSASGSLAYAVSPESPTEQYLSLRRAYPPRVGLTPQVLSESPRTYSGMTLEIEGRLAGMVRTEEGALLMLATDRGGTLSLTMSEVPTWVQPGTRLRVLAVATGRRDEPTSVTVGVPDMKVVAVASSSDIAAAEGRWEQEADERRRRDRREQAVLQAASATIAADRSARARMSGAILPSRGAILRAGAFRPYLSPAAQRIYPTYVSFVQKWNRRLSERDADAIASSILLYSERYAVDPRLVVSLIIAESDFHLSETSNKGAMGLGQLMPDEVRTLGLTNPYDPIQNIGGAVYLLRGRLDKYATPGGPSMQQIILALASYNAGMGAVKKYGGVPPYRETQNYVRKIERIYTQLCAGDQPG